MISEANLHAAVAAIDFFCVGEVVMVLPSLTMERHSNFTIKLFDRFQKKRGAMFSIFHGKEASWALRASHKNPISRTVNIWQQHPPVYFRGVLLGEEPLRAGKKRGLKQTLGVERELWMPPRKLQHCTIMIAPSKQLTFWSFFPSCLFNWPRWLVLLTHWNETFGIRYQKLLSSPH